MKYLFIYHVASDCGDFQDIEGSLLMKCTICFFSGTYLISEKVGRCVKRQEIIQKQTVFTRGLFCGFLDQIYSNVFHKVVNFEPFFLSRMPLSFPIKTPTPVNESVYLWGVPNR